MAAPLARAGRHGRPPGCKCGAVLSRLGSTSTGQFQLSAGSLPEGRGETGMYLRCAKAQRLIGHFGMFQRMCFMITRNYTIEDTEPSTTQPGKQSNP